MTKTTYVIRDGLLVEKPKPAGRLELKMLDLPAHIIDFEDYRRVMLQQWPFPSAVRLEPENRPETPVSDRSGNR